MHCPFCKEKFNSHDELQLHCLGCTTAESTTSRIEPTIDSAVVRFRWVKSRPCFEREVYLISSLAGSISLYWKLDEGLYESGPVGVPLGEHVCQLAVGHDGDVVTTEPFVVNEDSDVIFIILKEANYGFTSLDESHHERRRISDEARRRDQEETPDLAGTLGLNRYRRHLDVGSGDEGDGNTLSPLHRELLQHQLSHGQPSWVPGSEVQSPVMSDEELHNLAGRFVGEPFMLSSLRDQREDGSPRPVGDSRPIDLHNESDSQLSISDGGGNHGQSDDPRVPSSPSSNSELGSQTSRNSHAQSLANDDSASDASFTIPRELEASSPRSLSAITGDPNEQNHSIARLSSSPQMSPGNHHDFTHETNHLPNLTDEPPIECLQPTPRLSPLGSVLDTAPLPSTTGAGELGSNHVNVTSSIQRQSPTVSIHSSSLFSSNLPSPIMSPRDPSQSDNRVPMVSQGEVPVSLLIDAVRLQNRGGSVQASAGGVRGMSPRDHSWPSSSVERKGPSRSDYSTSTLTRQGKTDAMNFDQPSGDTPVLTEDLSSKFDRQVKDHRAVYNPPLQTSDMVTPTEENDGDIENSARPEGPSRNATSGAENPSQPPAKVPLTQRSLTNAWRGPQKSESATSVAQPSQRRRVSTPTVLSHNGPSRELNRSGHSSLPLEIGLPFRRSTYDAVTGDRDSYLERLASEKEALIQERDSFARELRQQAAHYDADLSRLRIRNEDLQQQLLNVETAANLTKQDSKRMKALEEELQGKDKQIAALQESISELEKTNRQLKDEQESLKTVNELRLDDINKLNTDLQKEVSVLRRKLAESSQVQRGKNEAKIIELQIDKNSLEKRMQRLDQENIKLRKQLKQAQQNSSSVTPGTRISKARSETDLSRKFEKYATYDKRKYKELEPVAKAIGYSSRVDNAALGTGRYSSLSTNDSRSYGLSPRIDMNGYSGANRRTLLSDSSTREPVTARGLVPRHRSGSLGEDSDVSDDLEHATSSRWRAIQTSEPSSSVVYRHPGSSLYRSHDRGVARRTRPHSYGGVGSVRDLYRGKDDLPSPAQQIKTSSYSQRPVDRHTSSSPHFSSADSPLLTSTAHQSSTEKAFTKPFAPTSSEDIRLGMEVLVTRSRGQIGRGKVKFVGQLPGKDEPYVGLELRRGEEGKHDGIWNGHRFFRCKENRGIFVSFDKVVMCYG